MPERTDQPQGQPTPVPCASCNGQQGAVVDTSSNGVVRQSWKRCASCSGSGTAGGAR